MIAHSKQLLGSVCHAVSSVIRPFESYRYRNIPTTNSVTDSIIKYINFE